MGIAFGDEDASGGFGGDDAFQGGGVAGPCQVGGGGARAGFGGSYDFADLAEGVGVGFGVGAGGAGECGAGDEQAVGDGQGGAGEPAEGEGVAGGGGERAVPGADAGVAGAAGAACPAGFQGVRAVAEGEGVRDAVPGGGGGEQAAEGVAGFGQRAGEGAAEGGGDAEAGVVDGGGDAVGADGSRSSERVVSGEAGGEAEVSGVAGKPVEVAVMGPGGVEAGAVIGGFPGHAPGGEVGAGGSAGFEGASVDGEGFGLGGVAAGVDAENESVSPADGGAGEEAVFKGQEMGSVAVGVPSACGPGAVGVFDQVWQARQAVGGGSVFGLAPDGDAAGGAFGSQAVSGGEERDGVGGEGGAVEFSFQHKGVSGHGAGGGPRPPRDGRGQAVGIPLAGGIGPDAVVLDGYGCGQPAVTGGAVLMAREGGRAGDGFAGGADGPVRGKGVVERIEGGGGYGGNQLAVQVMAQRDVPSGDFVAVGRDGDCDFLSEFPGLALREFEGP